MELPSNPGVYDIVQSSTSGKFVKPTDEQDKIAWFLISVGFRVHVTDRAWYITLGVGHRSGHMAVVNEEIKVLGELDYIDFLPTVRMRIKRKFD